ncbi:MAG: hypothetical protein KDI64_05745 [Candidatus Accumulibacter sp.]|nr:hypothetical protein [Accumulibacter sp.]
MTRALSAIAGSLLAAGFLAGGAAGAASDSAPASGPQVGDCVIFREGGAGRLLKAPTYWLKGSIAGISRQQRQLERCPRIGKPASAYTPADHARLAAAMPCLEHLSGSPARDVEVLRVLVTVSDWETPWSHQHGSTGWLFRGQFLGQTLQKGAEIDMDAAWLERCGAER